MTKFEWKNKSSPCSISPRPLQFQPVQVGVLHGWSESSGLTDSAQRASQGAKLRTGPSVSCVPLPWPLMVLGVKEGGSQEGPAGHEGLGPSESWCSFLSALQGWASASFQDL